MPAGSGEPAGEAAPDLGDRAAQAPPGEAAPSRRRRCAGSRAGSRPPGCRSRSSRAPRAGRARRPASGIGSCGEPRDVRRAAARRRGCRRGARRCAGCRRPFPSAPARPRRAAPRPSGRTARAPRDRAGHDQVRARDRDPVEDVLDAGDAADDLRRGPRLLLEQRLVLAVDPDVDRLGLAPGQVADGVLEELAEVRADAPARPRRSSARRSSMTSSTSPALSARLQPDHVVAAVGLGDEEAELGAGAPRVASRRREAPR